MELTLFQSSLQFVCLEFKSENIRGVWQISSRCIFLTPLEPNLNFDTGKSCRDINYNYFNQIWNFPVRPKVTQLQLFMCWNGIISMINLFHKKFKVDSHIVSHHTFYQASVCNIIWKICALQEQGHWFVFLPILRI